MAVAPLLSSLSHRSQSGCSVLPVSAADSAHGPPSGEPPESGALLGERHVPLLRHAPAGFELVASGLGLACCLAADAERVADLLPGRSLVACGVDEEICCSAECLVGVSHPGKVVQRSLRATAHHRQDLDGSADFPACVAACLSAHEPDRKHTFRQFSAGIDIAASIIVDESGITANCGKHANAWGSRSGVVGGSRRCRSLISSYISARRHPRRGLRPTTENKNDPREVAASGGRGHHQEMP